MGPISPYGPKQFGRLTEQDILNQADTFISQQQLCQKTDDIYPPIRLIIAKINIYGHRHLLDHIRNMPDKQKKIKCFNQWRMLNFQNLDLLFQNLIRKKIMRIDEEQLFTKIDVIEKYSTANLEQTKQIYKRGEEIIRQGRVGVIIFVGSSATKSEELFDKQFYKQKADDFCLFEIIMKRLQQIGDKYGFPFTYIFYNAVDFNKISEFIKKYKYKDRISTLLQNTHPILNLNGNLCLKAKDSADVIELPNGSGDFYHSSVRGVNILQKLKMDKVEYISCLDCQNILEMVIDPYVVGLLDANKISFDLMYKCTYPENKKQSIFRRVVLQNGIPKADNLQGLSSFINYNRKFRAQNTQNVSSSPVWMNSLIFQLESINSILKNAKGVQTFPQMVNYKMKFMNYWSPIDAQQHNNQACYVFERQISDLLINNLFKSQAVMVEREDEYLPVITQNKDYGWKQAYSQYKLKQKSQKVPFFQRTLPNINNNQVNIQSEILQ